MTSKAVAPWAFILTVTTPLLACSPAEADALDDDVIDDATADDDATDEDNNDADASRSSGGLVIEFNAWRDNGGQPINANGCLLWEVRRNDCPWCSEEKSTGHAFATGDVWACRDICAGWRGGAGYSWESKHLLVYPRGVTGWSSYRFEEYKYKYYCKTSTIDQTCFNPGDRSSYAVCDL